MAITELALGSTHLRSSWQNSFWMPADAQGGYALSVGPGSVSATLGTFVLASRGNNSFGGTLAPIEIQAGGQYVSSVTGVQALYLVDDVFAIGPSNFAQAAREGGRRGIDLDTVSQWEHSAGLFGDRCRR